MTPLKNAKHERFAQAMAAGKSIDAAYAECGYRPDRGHASRLAANGNIRKRVTELTADAAEKAGVTVERIEAELAAIAFANAVELASWGAEPRDKIRALELLGKRRGMFIEKHEHEVTLLQRYLAMPLEELERRYLEQRKNEGKAQ